MLKRKLFILAISISCAVSFISCSSQKEAEKGISFTEVEGNNGLKIVKESTKNYDPEKAPDWFDKLSVKDLGEIKNIVESTDISGVPESKDFLMLLASIPKEKISLYGCREGIIVQKEDHMQFFNWVYITPMGLLPQMNYGDYDQDGKKELAVSIHTGTGTGVSVDQLYVVRGLEDGKMKASEFTAEDYTKQLEERIKAQYTKKTSELQFVIDGKKQDEKINLKDLEKDMGTYQNIAFGQQICFTASKDEITFDVSPELYLGDLGAPFYDKMPNLSAKVLVQDGSFSLSDFTYQKSAE